jgi:hypothetical protein
VGPPSSSKHVTPVLLPALACTGTARAPMAPKLWWWSERENNWEVGGRYVGGREKFWGREEVEKN